MKFAPIVFSKRFPAVTCAVFVMHEPWDYSGGAYLGLRGTAAAIIREDGSSWVGVTLCSPHDQFVKKVGRAKAIGRAFQAMQAYYAANPTEIINTMDVTVNIPKLREACQLAIDEMKREKGIL